VLSERDLENARRAGALTWMPIVLSTLPRGDNASGEAHISTASPL
jgi:hypothetical protein